MASRSTTAFISDRAAIAGAGSRAKSLADIQRSRAAIERIGKLSDGLIGFGPFGIGLDGILAWVPGLGQIYSLGAGGYLLWHGYRAHVPTSALAKVAGIILARTTIDLGDFIPFVGIASSLIVDLFRGHRWSARILTRAIDETLYLEGGHTPNSPAYQAALDTVRRGGEKRRVVALG